MTAPSSELPERESPYPQNSFSFRAGNMSVPSVESSESVLRSRALFTKLVDKPYSFDSRVIGGDTVDMELPSGSHIQSDVESQVFNIFCSKSRCIRKWVVQGLSKDVAKSNRDTFPLFMFLLI